MSSCFDHLKNSLIDLLLILQTLSPIQRETIVRFERCEIDPISQNINLFSCIKSLNEKQLEHLIQISQFGDDYKQHLNDNSLKTLSKEQIITFCCIFRLLLLQETFYKFFSCEQFINLLEICRMPSFPQDLQLKILQQFQQFLIQILPETLENMHKSIKEAKNQGNTSSNIIFNLLESFQDKSLLNEPLSKLLQCDLDTIFNIQQCYPKLQPIQIVQLVRLLQMDNHWNILEIRQLLSPDQSGWKGLQNLLSDTDSEMIDSNNESNSTEYSLSILEQPPDRTVYKRCLKPNPTIMISSKTQPILDPGETLCVVPVLYRFDTDQPVLFLNGNIPITTSVGSRVVFKRLKVMKTSRQLDDTLFYLRFELRKTDGNKQSDSLACVQSKPFFVVSHSTLLPTTAPTLPSIAEIVPCSGGTSGGTRVAVIGSNFEETPALLVKFDNIFVKPEVHGSGTLICVTPSHTPGEVDVSVSNNGKDFGKPGSFIFEDILQNNINLTQSTQQALSQDVEHLFKNMDASDLTLTEDLFNAGFYPFSPLHHAAAFGNEKLVELLLSSNKIPVNTKDKFGRTALYWALYFGHEHLLFPLIKAGADINQQDNDGNSVIHLASTLSAQLLAKLVYLGGWINVISYDGLSCLHKAVIKGDIDIIKVLLRCGANINEEDDEGETSLHYAVREQQGNIVQLLINEGIAINHQNEDGETALHISVCNESNNITQILLESGLCNLSIIDNTGATALSLATENTTKKTNIQSVNESTVRIINLLMEFGAKNNKMKENLFYNTQTPSSNYFINNQYSFAWQRQSTVVN